MLQTFDRMVKCTLAASGTQVGKLADLYFDDSFWTIRYFVIDTKGWLTGRQVLISPYSVTAVDPQEQRIETAISAQQVEDSPAPEADLPVSRQFEVACSQYYGYPHYWTGPYAWGAYTIPELMPPSEDIQEHEGWDSHLRSAAEVEGYQVDAVDGQVGHVADFVVDDTDWAIRYLVVDTRNWWPGKHVLLSPAWAEEIDWAKRTLSVDVARDAIKQAPEYHAGQPITRDYEIALFGHYCKDCYWEQ